MADDKAPVTPGKDTTEYFITKVTVALGIAATVAGFAEQFLGMLHTAFPQAAWVGAIMSAVGLAVTVLKALGYTNARKEIKVAEQAATATVTVSDPDGAAAHLASVQGQA